jgi:hypothetical protein
MEDISNLINESETVYYADSELCSEFDPAIHKKYNAEFYFQVGQLELIFLDIKIVLWTRMGLS